MNILLNITYDTSFGEELVLNLITGREEGSIVTTPYRMHTNDGHVWKCDLNLGLETGTHIDYYYTVVRGETTVVRSEWVVEPHRLELTSMRGGPFVVYDHWLGIPSDSYLYSSAFTDCIRRRRMSPAPLVNYPVTARVKVRAPQLKGARGLCL